MDIRIVYPEWVVLSSPGAHRRHYQLHSRTVAPSAINKRLVPRHLCGLASCSEGSVDSDQELVYRITVLAPHQTLSPPLSQFLCLLRPLQPPSHSSRTEAFSTTSKTQTQNEGHGHGRPPDFINCLSMSQRSSMSLGPNTSGFCFSTRFDTSHCKEGYTVENALTGLGLLCNKHPGAPHVLEGHRHIYNERCSSSHLTSPSLASPLPTSPPTMLRQ